MAASYAALVSLSHILHQILNLPPTYHYMFPRETVESLRDTVSFLIDFLETYPSRRSQEIENVEARIIDAAYEGEDIIESDVVRRILAIAPNMNSFAFLGRSIQMKMRKFLPIQKVMKKSAIQKVMKVIQSFTSIQKDLLDIKSRKGVEEASTPEISTRSSSSTSLPGGKSIMVGFDERLNQIRSDLASDDSKLRIIPIVGMGGIGKTTLAANVYVDPYITETFDIRAWVSVSQEYKVREILITLLQQINSKIEGNKFNTNDVGLLLHKELYGRRYLIVLDDMWEIQCWNNLRLLLPDTGDGSRILVTTRIGELATHFGSCSPHQMSLLDEKNSWNLIREYVKEDCPIELEEIGRSIARGCGGLPLALVVIGGLLAKSDKARDFWEYVDQNVSSIANYEDDKKCIEILRLSYSQLPVHLKPCFLYLAVFPKNFEIRMSRLIRLWVAEGFIKAGSSRSLEEVAEGYVKDLVDRNLVMISKRGYSGKMKKCSIHDFIRELCSEEALKKKFVCIAKLDDRNTSPHLERERRLSIHTSTAHKALRLRKHSRSLLSYSSSARESRGHILRGRNLLRVLDAVESYSIDEIVLLLNSRYIACAVPRESRVSSCLSLLWNLQTLVFPVPMSLPYEFWRMPQLRHLKIPGITLADPLQDEEEENLLVLKNLQTLKTVRNFMFSENVVRRIPNLKKLGIDCYTTEGIESFCLSNLALSLHKLESLVLKCRGSWRKMAFPDSLIKLTLSHCQIPWEDMSVVGTLPKLEVLKLQKRAATGKIWKPNPEEFLRLKLLLIDWCQLEIWEADDSHFPSLEHLQLVGVRMEEFPCDFAQIAALQTIDLNYCSEALLLSAKTMSADRENYGFEDIQIRSFPSQASTSRKKTMVGLEDEAEKLKCYLFEESEALDMISIVGMGGHGKTTLARKIFSDPEIQNEFPIRIWISVTSEFSERNAFLSILREFTILTEDIIYDKSEAGLAQFLGLTKFLLVMDDVWTIEDVDRLRIVLPEYNRKSKVLITTRSRNVSEYASRHRNPHVLRFLNNEESWLLLQLEVFGKPEFPSELEVEGRQIAQQCLGLPLLIVLIGGILRKFSALDEMSAMKEALKEALERFNNDEFDFYEKINSIAYLSYETLPYHLRNCFLYVGTLFPDGYEIPTWKLLCMWIAEGFIQQEDGISLEESAEKYLDDLISSNLLIADKLNADGKVKTCSIHDILRDVCIREARTDGENFFQETRHEGKPLTDGENFFQEIKMSRHKGTRPLVYEDHKYQRLCIHSNVLDFLSRKPYGSGARSFACFSKEHLVDVPKSAASAIASGFKQLQVLDIMPLKITQLPQNMYELLHLRYMALSFNSAVLPAAFSNFWNIQTLVVDTTSPTLDVKAGILNMIELRHFKTNASATLTKPDTSSGGGENIQTLGMISPESCTEEVFDRARNLKKLGIRGKLAFLLEDKNRSFNSLGKLDNLEKLKLVNDVPFFGRLRDLPPADKFPVKLRSLTLCETFIDWSYMSILGSLENLEVLKLKDYAFQGHLWEASSDGGFPHLEVLHIGFTDLETWVASHQNFPSLKSLELRNCELLQEVPIELADVPNFQRLHLYRCSSAAASAKRIDSAKKKQEEDEQSGNVRRFSLIISPPP